MKYKYLFFDLDHTLWDFDANARDCLEDMYARLGLKKCGVSTFDEFLTIYTVHNGEMWRQFEQGQITSDYLKWRRMQLTLLDFKIVDDGLSQRMSELYLQILPQKNKVYDYTHEILNYLSDKGYQLNVLTNGFEETQQGKLANSDLTKYFRHVVTSESANAVKPQKQIFDFAMNQAGASLSNSLMIGDNLGTDIAGAVNVGMDSVFVNLYGRDVQSGATYDVMNLKELERIL